MGSYGIGVGQNAACIVEAHHDEKGIAWPAEVAPYAAHIVEIGADRDPQVRETAERLHQVSIAAGREALHDDRDERPGVKFTDADLLGMPWIVTVSPALAGRRRHRGDRARDRRALDPLDRGRRGPARRRLIPARPAVPRSGNRDEANAR